MVPVTVNSMVPDTISCAELLPYTLGESSKLKKEIYFHPAWMEMIQDNMVSILGWIQYEKVKWLQNNNPEVPGLVYKLAPMDSSLNKEFAEGSVKKLDAKTLERLKDRIREKE